MLLDGFDLGVGILFPFARSAEDRSAMMDSIAPVWDGNETWLVLGGGGLFAAFPLAYAVIMPALYLPIYLMLTALVLRGVAFEFRLRGRRRGKQGWTIAFAAGSITAAFAQGLVLGGFIQGVTVRDNAFAGGPFDWLTPIRCWSPAAWWPDTPLLWLHLADLEDQGRAARRRSPLGVALSRRPPPCSCC